MHQNSSIPDSKVHGANTGPTWVLSAQDGPHVGPMNLTFSDVKWLYGMKYIWIESSLIHRELRCLWYRDLGCLKMKIPLYQHRDSHYIQIWYSHHHYNFIMGNPYTWTDGLDIHTELYIFALSKCKYLVLLVFYYLFWRCNGSKFRSVLSIVTEIKIVPCYINFPNVKTLFT